MSIISILGILITAVISNNVILSQTQGLCPFLGVSKKMSSAIGMGFAVIFVLVVSTIFTCLTYNYILVPLDLTYLKTMAFILVIASLVQITEIIIKRFSPTLYSALGVYLPLITTNCAILGTADSAVAAGYSFIGTFTLALGNGIGFLLAILLLAGVRIRTDKANVPKCFRGFPLTLITAGIIALAFVGIKSVF